MSLNLVKDEVCNWCKRLTSFIVTPPVLPEPDTTYDRYIEMSIVTGDALMTAEDMQEFSDFLDEDAQIPF